MTSNKYNKHITEGSAYKYKKQQDVYTANNTQLPTYYRFVVLEIVPDPSIIDDNKIAYWEQTFEISNIKFAKSLPRNAIIAKRIMNFNNAASSPAMFLFPFFSPHISLPLNPGEHVWVMFENQTSLNNDLGYWMSRIVEPGHVEDVNHTHAPRSFDSSYVQSTKDQHDGTNKPICEFRNGKVDEKDGVRYTLAETMTLSGDEDVYEKLITETESSKLAVIEPVPRFKKRPADLSLEGTNNTLIVLGRDRTGVYAEHSQDDTSKAKIISSLPKQDTLGEDAGAIDIVVGRGQTEATLGKVVDNFSINGTKIATEISKASQDLYEKEGDPDFYNDRSRILASSKTHVDRNFGLQQFNAQFDISESEDGDGAIVVKSDKIRFIARSDIELVVSPFEQRDKKGRMIDATLSDSKKWAAIILKANGEIIIKPADNGVIKLGGEDADKGIVCSDMPVSVANGGVSGAPLVTTMGGLFAGATPAGKDNAPALAPGQAKFANKVLIK